MENYCDNRLKTPNKLTFLIGVDGSGKSALLESISQKENTICFEPASDIIAKEFKENNLNNPIDGEIINEHENMFLDINHKYDHLINLEYQLGHNVVTTGNILTTFIAHSLMRNIVDSRALLIENSVESWLKSDAIKPTEIVFLHAPDEAIIKRIKKRQDRGDYGEKFWGYNSPYFLSRYQDSWRSVVSRLAEKSLFRCISLDTSLMSRETTYFEYERLSNLNNE